MYKFDYRLDSSAVFKERFVWTLYLGIVFFLLYGSANQFAYLTSPHPSFVMDWEYNIPFIEYFIIPYMSSDIMFCIALMMTQTRFQLRVLALRILVLILLSIFIFLLYPLQFSFEKPNIQVFTFLFGLLEADLSFNQAPSLHIGFAVVLWFSMKEIIKNIFIKGFLFIWFLLICVSTLFVYQHHFIDIPTGLLMGFLVVYIIPYKKNKFTTSFTTPRSIKLALYYLFASIIFMIGFFKSYEYYDISFLFILTYINLYLFLSFFSLSIVYAFGFNFLLVKKNGYVNCLQFVLFLPYFYIFYLSWNYYSSRGLSLISKVNDNFYIGRQPDEKELIKIRRMGFTKVINLALDQPFQDRLSNTVHYRCLDMTIQDPLILKNIVNEIKLEIDKGGKVFLHCTLGMSRTIIVLSAYLLEEGMNLNELDDNIDSIRKDNVKGKYVRVNQEFYASFLKE